jgi:endonuclease-3
MARKSPRARKKDATPSRLPGKGRPRSTPGSGRTKPRRAKSRAAAGRGRHALTGARAKRGPARRPAAKRSLAKRAVAKRTAAKTPRPPARRRRFTPPEPDRVRAILLILERAYPEATTALHFQSPLQLLIATILSAQCTDARVNQVTPGLFERYPDAAALAGADRGELEDMIRSTGFYRNKAKSIQACCADLVAKYGGEVPRTLEELTALHGVGRKTANVVLGNAFGTPGLVVDTHVSRLSLRLGLTDQTDPVKIEFALMPVIPRDRWTLFSHWLILHGRRICVARKPLCSICPLAVHCPRIGVSAAA